MSDEVLFFYPLFGATADQGLAIGQFSVVTPSWAEWEGMVDKTDIVAERAGYWRSLEMVGDDPGVTPPACLLAVADSMDEWPAIAADVEPAILGLRLAGLASFFDPRWTISAAYDNGMKQRSAGPYRLLGYGCLTGAEDRISPSIAAEAERLGGLVTARGAGLALQPLRLIGAPSLGWRATVIVAMQQLEGLYGRLNERIGGITIVDRLAAAGIAQERAEWLGAGEGRAIRNAAAHGRAVSVNEASLVVDAVRAAVVAFVETEPVPGAASPVDGFLGSITGA